MAKKARRREGGLKKSEEFLLQSLLSAGKGGKADEVATQILMGREEKDKNLGLQKEVLAKIFSEQEGADIGLITSILGAETEDELQGLLSGTNEGAERDFEAQEFLASLTEGNPETAQRLSGLGAEDVLAFRDVQGQEAPGFLESLIPSEVDMSGAGETILNLLTSGKFGGIRRGGKKRKEEEFFTSRGL